MCQADTRKFIAWYYVEPRIKKASRQVAAVKVALSALACSIAWSILCLEEPGAGNYRVVEMNVSSPLTEKRNMEGEGSGAQQNRINDHVVSVRRSWTRRNVFLPVAPRGDEDRVRRSNDQRASAARTEALPCCTAEGKQIARPIQRACHTGLQQRYIVAAVAE